MATRTAVAATRSSALQRLLAPSVNPTARTESHLSPLWVKSFIPFGASAAGGHISLAHTRLFNAAAADSAEGGSTSASPPEAASDPISVSDFVRAVGGGVETNADKVAAEISSLSQLLSTRSGRLKKIGLPCQQRKRLLSYLEKYKQSMNIFRLAGDMTHLLSVVVLLLKIITMKSCAGISLKTQELYVMVFVTRYLDLFYAFVSVYNSVMKVIFLASSFAIVYYMRYDKIVKHKYDKEHDTFRHVFLVIPCLVLALLVNRKFTVTEVLWTFSIYLEAVAIMPQLVLLQRTKNIDNLTGNYVFFLGAYRGFYILNWIYRYITEPHYKQWIVWISGLVQTALYADFFYYYIISWKNNKRLSLPA
ncbi:unnamed protein product [Closterium sp. Yama58-4]|nr:unnamed protein product [Closterium sp. Yama58-4]